MTQHFRDLLSQRQEAVNSLLCVGLDPLMENLPNMIARKFPDDDSLFIWMRDIVDATAPFVSMFKPQRAHWEKIPGGITVLRKLVQYIRRHHPDIVIFLDCKRGDIGRTQSCYGYAHFILDGVHGMNFNPYMGKDCIEYLFDQEHPERSLVSLAYTSNLSARQTQDVLLADGRPYWEYIVELTLEWAKEIGAQNVGLVMAAAYENPKGSGTVYAEHLLRCRKIVGNKFWFLIPGIGTQGGFVEETVKAAFTGSGSIAVNSSSGIIFASQEDDYAEASAQEAKKLRDQMREAGGNC